MSSAAVLQRPETSKQTAQADEAVPASLSALLDAGKFALYHLEKAKLALAEDNLVQAQYQLKASFAHDRLPEAIALKAKIKASGAR